MNTCYLLNNVTYRTITSKFPQVAEIVLSPLKEPVDNFLNICGGCASES